MKICKVYKNGKCIDVADKRQAVLERRTEYRPTWPYYLALIVFAAVLAVVISKCWLN